MQPGSHVEYIALHQRPKKYPGNDRNIAKICICELNIQPRSVNRRDHI